MIRAAQVETAVAHTGSAASLPGVMPAIPAGPRRLMFSDFTVGNLASQKIGLENGCTLAYVLSPGSLQATLTPGSNPYRTWSGAEYSTTGDLVATQAIAGSCCVYVMLVAGALIMNLTGYQAGCVPIGRVVVNNVAPSGVTFFTDDTAVGETDESAYQQWRESVGFICEGLDLSYTSGDGSLDVHAKVVLSLGRLMDYVRVARIGPTGDRVQTLNPLVASVLLRNGATSWKHGKVDAIFPLMHEDYLGTALPRIDDASDTGLLVTSGNFFAVWVVATMSDEPIRVITGQRQDASLPLARANNTLAALTGLDRLNFPRYRPLYRIIFEANSAFTNAVKARIVHVQDLRRIDSFGPERVYSSPPVLHEGLAGRDVADTHPDTAITATTAAVPGNWPTTPATVHEALDVLAGVAAGAHAGHLDALRLPLNRFTNSQTLDDTHTSAWFDTTIGALTCWLPAPADAMDRKIYVVGREAGANNLTVNANGGAFVGGGTTEVINTTGAPKRYQFNRANNTWYPC